jgi:HAD superfamily hydrolase (TIGR01490 family)
MHDVLTAEILRGPAGPQVAAFVDFDGTVIHGYSAGALYRHRIRNFELGPREAARTLLIGLRGIEGDAAFESFFTLGMQAWAGRSEDELEELGERLFRQELGGRLYPEAWSLVHAHKLMGHTVVLASSATLFQVKPFLRELGLEHALTSPLEVEGGLLTGRPGGELLWGAGKARAVERFAAEHDIDLTASYAYSNGREDVPFLETVGRPRPVNPDDELARAAAERGWPTRDFPSRGRPGLVQVARTAASYGGIFSSFAVGMGVGLLNGSRRQAIDVGTTLAGEIGLALAGVSVNVQGEEHLWARRPAVFMFNHQSQLDMLLVLKLVRRGFTGVAKKEIASQPPWGQMFRFADVAFVDRGNTMTAREALAPAVERLRSGVSLVIAPEGTRSHTPRLGRFKKGGFHIAMQAGVPIVPIVVRNASEAQWRGSRTIRPTHVDVVVLPAIDVGGWSRSDLNRHVAETRQLFVDTLERWPGSIAARGSGLVR